MLTYPQLGTGALGQFPILKTRSARTVINTAADGTSIKLADPAGARTHWVLSYTDLADDEIAALLAFFQAAEGSLNGFTFLDPAANLLAWSDALGNEVWQRDPLLTLVGAKVDPLGGTNGWQLTNSGDGPQAIAQTLGAPGEYLYCLSAYVRANAPSTVQLRIADESAGRSVGPEWSRILFAATGTPGAASTLFGIAADARASIQVFGMQAEPQAGASAYKVSTSGGVYPDAHFASDSIAITATDVNRHACKVTIIHAKHI